MKTKLLLVTTMLLAAALTAHAGPISKGGFVISKPGKYFLTKNINALLPAGYNGPVGIVIQTNDVELDLAGFTISPTNNVGVGVYLVEGVRRVRVHNGRIQGVQSAIFGAADKNISSCLFERLQIADCSNDAVRFEGFANVIRSCTVTNVAPNHHGIVVSTDTGGFNEVTDCTVSSDFGAQTGINAAGTDGLIVRRCIVEAFSDGYHMTTGCKLFDNLS
ncbi:MAG: right-handed parallel beta-helix repeat-containing protein, partial [Chthoniobacteraceae bacterium]